MIRSGDNDLSKYKCWKLFRATLKGLDNVFNDQYILTTTTGLFTLIPVYIMKKTRVYHLVAKSSNIRDRLNFTARVFDMRQFK